MLRITAINDYAMYTIEGAQATPSSPNALVRVVQWPFNALAPSQPSRDALLTAFRNSLNVHSSELEKVVLELTASTAALDDLDAHLSALHELCAAEDLAQGAARDALLSELWTILGGNRRRVRTADAHLGLLRDVGQYRRRAAAHIAAASQTVDAMAEEIEELRARVAAPELTEDRIPIEVHMKSIRSGMERIQEQRAKAKEREEQLMNRILGIDA